MPDFEKAAKFQAWLLYGPLLIPPLFIIINPVGFLAFAGAWMVVKPKISSKKRTKKLIEWGSSSMTVAERRSYRIGWGVIVFTFVICITLKVIGF
jgi:hypothetical protein